MWLLRLTLFVALTCGSVISKADWTNSAGEKLPDTEFRKTVDGFGAYLLLTTPNVAHPGPNNLPIYDAIKTIKRGSDFAIVMVVSNPLVNPQGDMDVSARISVYKPDGSLGIEQSVKCLRGELQGTANKIRICENLPVLHSDLDDPVGNWQVEVKIRDSNRQSEIVLNTSLAFE